MTILIDGKQLDFFKFSGGEIQVNVENVFGSQIVCVLKSSDEIMALILAVNAIRRHRKINISLYIYYFPYSRQDRVCNPGEAFSLQVMCKLINDLGCEEVYIIDPHSDVLPALLNNCKIITLKQILGNFDFTGLTICCPDAGAIKRVSTITNDYVLGLKSRNTKTGEVELAGIYGEVENKDILIIDDICDGGSTFINLSKELQNMGAASISLYVTHGIFSKGIDVLRNYFKRVYCLYSFETYPKQEFIQYVTKPNSLP